MMKSRRKFLVDSFVLGGSLLLGCSEPDRNEANPQEVASHIERKPERAASTDAMAPDESWSTTESTEFLKEVEVETKHEALQEHCRSRFRNGKLMGVVPFINEGGKKIDQVYGEGWDGRLYSDLSKLKVGESTISNDKFFVRTRFPDKLKKTDDWKVRLHGLGISSRDIRLETIQAQSKPLGISLFECSGNGKGGKFGLLGAAEWTGVSLKDLFQHLSLTVSGKGPRVLVSGFDDHSSSSTHSTPGASWVFTWEEITRAGGFLATGMNGVPLPKDHGFPLRFVMPNWYGCTCIKWVNEIKIVGESEPATPQMIEFASRTHQQGKPKLAKDYKSAVIDQAAMPIRIEKWSVGGSDLYRVIGIMWGGYATTEKLMIRFHQHETYEQVAICPTQKNNRSWTFWEHVWEPTNKGTYSITCKIDDPKVRQHRLDNHFYLRQVKIA